MGGLRRPGRSNKGKGRGPVGCGRWRGCRRGHRGEELPLGRGCLVGRGRLVCRGRLVSRGRLVGQGRLVDRGRLVGRSDALEV